MKFKLISNTLAVLSICAANVFTFANATLIDRGNGLIYDTVQDITWLQDANLSGQNMRWAEAVNWANDLEFGGFDDWRLNSVDVTCSGRYNCKTSELGHLYYNEFGLSSGSSLFSATGQGLINLNLFKNLKDAIYWSGNQRTNDPSSAWYTYTGDGSQSYLGVQGFNNIFSWAVRDGDVLLAQDPNDPIATPSPSAFSLIIIGILGLALTRSHYL